MREEERRIFHLGKLSAPSSLPQIKLFPYLNGGDDDSDDVSDDNH